MGMPNRPTETPCRLIAFDIDGTLYDSNKQIRPATLTVLEQVRELGVTVAIASGRPLPGLAQAAAALTSPGHRLLLVSYNGARVTDAASGEVLFERPVALPTAQRLLRHLEDFPVVPLVDDGHFLYATDPAAFRVAREAENCNLEIRVVGSVAEAVDFAPAKVLMAAPAERLAEIATGITAPFTDELSFVFSSPIYLEATTKDVGKGGALAALCAQLGIAREEVMAFGDAQNDLSMIEFAGHGVAMGNACEELKRAADEVTLTNDEDGIAETLRRLFSL